MRIAAAQSISHPGDIPANVHSHLRMIEAARAAAVDLLLFPELSLSGYELPLLADCLLHPEDERLRPIRQQAEASGMTVVVGAPVAGAQGTLIGAISCYPDGGIALYGKQHLHGAETRFAVAGEPDDRCHALLGESLALAICADTGQASHAQRAAANGASLYLASVLLSTAAYAADAGNLQGYAETLAMGVLMANHGGPSGDYISAGKSAFWAPGGRQVVAAPTTGEGLVIASREAHGWCGEWLALNVAPQG